MPSESLKPVHVIAAILLAGEMFRKSLPEKETGAIASRMVKLAQAIVDASN